MVWDHDFVSSNLTYSTGNEEVWQSWSIASVLKIDDHRKVVHWFESSSFRFKVKQAKPNEVKSMGTGMSYGQDSR